MCRTACLAVILVLAAACSSTETIVVSSGADASADQPSTTAAPTTTTEPGTAEVDPAGHLLTEQDLPGWRHTGPMTFEPEPTYEAIDCELMATVWSAHGRGGTRVRAMIEDATLRQAVVQMPDVASAEAVIDGADRVWLECNPLTIDTGDEWWVEPIQVPEIAGWESSGIALGLPGGLIWSTAWFQRGTTVVFVDLDATNPWPVLDSLLTAAAGRIAGKPAPVPTTASPTSSTTSVVPGTGGGDWPPDTSTPGDDWREHPAAVHVPDPSLFGPGYEIDWVRIEERAPSDPDQIIEACPVDPPPTMDGLVVEFEHESGTPEIELLVGIDDAIAAQQTVDAFRSLGDCDPAALDASEMTVTEPDSAADDAVALEWSPIDSSYGAPGLAIVARYGDRVVGIGLSMAAEPTGQASWADLLVRWADTIAARN